MCATGAGLAKSTSRSREFDGFRLARPILTRWASSVPIPMSCQGTTGPPPPARWALSRDSSTRRYDNVEQDNNRAGRRNRSRHRHHGIGRDRASSRQRCQSGDQQYGGHHRHRQYGWHHHHRLLPAVRWRILQHRLSAVRSSLQARTRHLVISAVGWVEPLRNPSSCLARI